MGVLKWVGLIAAGWFALSILVGVAWALGGRRILRQPPKPPVKPYEVTFTGDYEIDRRQLDEWRRTRGDR